MTEPVMNFQEFIDLISSDSKIHINMVDLSGTSENEMLKPDRGHRVHSMPVCQCAKETSKGLSLCLKCKKLTIKKAMTDKNGFDGFCPLGLYEYVKPVYDGERLLGIIYAGNLVTDIKFTESRMRKTAKLTGVNVRKLINSISSTEITANKDLLIKKANTVCEYYRMLHRKIGSTAMKQGNNFVNNIKNDVKAYYSNDISISELASIYGFNSQYAGRIFKEQTGESFNEYLNRIRIENACAMLEKTNMSIIEIAMECGFNNVTYFNKIFKKYKKITPGNFREQTP